MKNILAIILTLISLNATSQTWEYKHSGNYKLGITIFSDEFIEGEIFTTSVIFDDISSTSIIKTHDLETGVILDSANYQIDSLSSTLLWAFFSDSLQQYFIAGQAQTKELENKRGYFLLTTWDINLNLLSDTIIRLQPTKEKNTIWYLVGNQTKINEYMVIGYQNDDPNNLTARIKTILVKINDVGHVEKIKWFRWPETKSNQKNIFYDDILKKYIIISGYIYILDSNLDIEKEIAKEKIINNTSNYVGLANKFSDSKYISTYMYNNWLNNGLALLDKNFNYIKGININSDRSDEWYDAIARKNYDYIDTSEIFTANTEVYRSHITIAKLNSNLDPYWIKYLSLNDSIYHYLWSITATTDGGFALTGGIGKLKDIIKPNLAPSKLLAWIKKFDKNGNSVTTQDTPNSLWEITVFPNPSQGDFKIEIAGDANKTKLKLFDLQGRKVKVYNNLISGSNHIDMYNLPKGIYVWKLEKEGKILGSGKWVKE